MSTPNDAVPAQQTATEGPPEVCGHRFLSTCVREKGHEPPHRDGVGNEWRGIETKDFPT